MQKQASKELTPEVLRDLRIRSIRSRIADLQMTYRAGMGHIGSDFSCMDILTVLYFWVLRVDPSRPDWADRDRFVLSKGHAAGALYVTLAARGFFPEDWLHTYQGFNTRLPGHPDRLTVPGVEHNTGALGHGLPVAAGMAAGLRLEEGDADTPRVYVLVGDGELQEGSNWEAIMAAAHMGLDNLIAIVDRNRIQQGAETEQTVRLGDLRAKWESFGWEVRECEGHDIAALAEALGNVPQRPGRPTVVIAHTIKGRGVSFMENTAKWHHRIPTPEEYAAAMAELESQLAVAEGE